MVVWFRSKYPQTQKGEQEWKAFWAQIVAPPPQRAAAALPSSGVTMVADYLRARDADQG